ncbi:MAG: ClpXP protease specificity-enhancing factor SspB [Pseudoprimorskyibacter sp.]|jgi:hypothetical protein|nr:ClpXP protease specificity-enhancing factor SspB [Pseudoprimorskyibacter sp.]
MSRTIDYGNLMHCAMRGLIQEVLQDVSERGLPGEHHFFITFDTRHPDVQIADWLSDRYPEDMTVVMQQWFEDLEVTDDGFGVSLNFGDAPERLYVPYDAIKTFVDPSVEFGLRFETQEEEAEDSRDTLKSVPEAPMVDVSEDEDTEAAKADAEVVSLDSFRKS